MGLYYAAASKETSHLIAMPEPTTCETRYPDPGEAGLRRLQSTVHLRNHMPHKSGSCEFIDWASRCRANMRPAGENVGAWMDHQTTNACDGADSQWQAGAGTRAADRAGQRVREAVVCGRALWCWRLVGGAWQQARWQPIRCRTVQGKGGTSFWSHDAVGFDVGDGRSTLLIGE